MLRLKLPKCRLPRMITSTEVLIASHPELAYIRQKYPTEFHKGTFFFLELQCLAQSLETAMLRKRVPLWEQQGCSVQPLALNPTMILYHFGINAKQLSWEKIWLVTVLQQFPLPTSCLKIVLSLSLQQKAAVPLQGKPTRAGSRRAAPSLTFPEHLHANHTVDLEGTLKCHLVQLPSSKQGQSHAGCDPHGLKTHELITALTGYLCL